MSPELVKIGVFIGQVLFFAGVGYAVFRRVVKDLNGLGQSVRRDRDVNDYRFVTEAMTAIALEENSENRKWLAEKFIAASDRRTK